MSPAVGIYICTAVSRLSGQDSKKKGYATCRVPQDIPCLWQRCAKVEKSARWMPRLMEAMKDVISCDKPRVGANDH